MRIAPRENLREKADIRADGVRNGDKSNRSFSTRKSSETLVKMAVQHPSYKAESVEESPMMPAVCGQAGEGTVAMDDMLKAWCQDSIPGSPNTEAYNNEETAPEPLLAMREKAAIVSIPHQNGDGTAIASSVSTSETQTAAVPPQRPGYEVSVGMTSRKEPGSVKGGPLAAEQSDHEKEGDDECGLGEQHQERNGPQATQAVVMQRNLAKPSASVPGGAAEQRDHQIQGCDENSLGIGEQHQEHSGPQATQVVEMRRNLAKPSASLPGAAAEQSDHPTEGSEERDREESPDSASSLPSVAGAAHYPASAQNVVGHRPRGSRRLQRQRSRGRHVEDGPPIMHDGDGVVINLRRAREQARQWSTSNRVCWEENPPVSVEPCGHHLQCPQCFHGPYTNSLCPVCCQPIEGYKFNQAMLKWLVRRSS